MAGVTDFYGLAFFDFADDLGSPINVQKEIDRFVVIDKQLYGLFSVFGNGVVTGWEVSDGNDFNVEIASGVGIAENLALESSFPTTIGPLPTNSIVNIYAAAETVSAQSRDVNFYFSDYGLGDSSDPTVLLLARVTTGGQGITLIDNTVRTKISFKDIIAEEIADHRHDGVSAPKIDLASEVQGLLPMDRLSDIDAGKFTSGKLPQKVIPTIDHSSLLNIGNFSHSQLDTLVQLIQKDNIGLIGEIATANLLKSVMERKYTSANSDRYFINELAIMPGISPDSFIDWDATTAAVDKVNNCISGIPALVEDTSGVPVDFDQLQVLTISWTTDTDFNNAPVLTNLTVDGNVQLSSDSVFDRVIDDFEPNGSAPAVPGSTIPGYNASLVETTTTKLTYDSSAYDGTLGGKFQSTQTRYAVFRKDFTSLQDWTAYDTLTVHVKNFGATHSAVYIAFKDKDNNDLFVKKILSEDEVTTFDNILTNGYAEKSFDITSVTRNKVAGYVIYTGKILNESEAFYVDGIFLRALGILLPQGNLRLRYNTSSPVVFNSVEFTLSDFPDGTDFKVRVRVANSLEELVTAQFSSLLNSGEIFSLNGSYIEIDLIFLADDTRKETPVLEAVYLTMLVPSVEAGMSISSSAQWADGSLLNNIDVGEDLIQLDNKNVGDIYFANENLVNELNPDLIPVVGVNGNNIPITPAQGYQGIIEQQQYRGFSNPKSALRLQSGNYLVCDTGNDRVIEVTEDGLFVRGFASHNADYAAAVFVTCANYNPRLGTLFVAYSAPVDITNFDLSQITLFYDGQSRFITLDNEADTVRTLVGTILSRNVVSGVDPTPGTDALTERVLCVILSQDKQEELADIDGDLFVQVSNDINVTPIECFYGDYMYFGVGGIAAPVHAYTLEDDSEWLVCNANVTKASATAGTSISIIQFNLHVAEPFQGIAGQYIGTTFASAVLDFSDIVLGSVYELGNDKILVAGLQKIPSADPAAATSDTAPASTNPTDAKKLEKYTGQVVVVDKQSGLISFRYQSPDGLYPSDAIVDDDGFYTIAESSISPQNGRVVRLDQFGNIIWITQDGMFTKVNDVRLVDDNHLFVST